jgi:protein disulfide-isomerase
MKFYFSRFITNPGSILAITVTLGLILSFTGACKEISDENAMLELYSQASVLAAKNNQRLLLVFGADWCGDCRSLRDRFNTNPDIRSTLEKNYLILNIDVGEFDKNIQFAEKFQNPEKNGIPALVVVDPAQGDKVIVSTEGGEFSEASQMDDKAILDFLKKHGNAGI